MDINDQENNRSVATLVWLGRYIKPHWIYLILSALTLCGVVAFNITQVHITNLIITFTFDGEFNQVLNLILLLGIIVVAGLVIIYIRDWSVGVLASRTIRDIRDRFTNRLIALPVSFHDSTHSGELMSRYNNEMSAIESYIRDFASKTIFQPVMFLAAFLYLLFIDWRLLLVSICFAPFTVLLIKRFSKVIERYQSTYFKKLSESNRHIEDTLGGMAVVKSYCLEDRQVHKVNNLIRDCADTEIRSKKWYYGGMLPLFIVMNHFPRIICALVGGHMVIRGEITSGELLAFILSLAYLIQPMKELPDLIKETYLFIAAGHRLAAIDKLPQERQTGGNFSNLDADPIVEFRNVTLEYNPGEEIIHNLSFCIPPKKFIAIVGPSGSGKSSILNLLTGFYSPLNGTVCVYGEELEKWSLENLRSQFAYVPQDDLLFPGTIEDNIRFGNPHATREQIIHAAKLANIHSFISNLPNGYQHLVSERGNNLSGGQKQRLSVARAIVSDAPIILLDEATSALDLETEAALLANLKQLKGERTIIAVAHRLDTIRAADQIIVMNNGKLEEMGSHIQLIRLKGMYHNLFNKELKGGDDNNNAEVTA